MNKLACTFVLILSTVLGLHAQPAQEDNAVQTTLEVLNKDASQFLGKTITFSGKTVHVCGHSGMKMFFEIPGSKSTFEVKSTEKLGKFSRRCNNHNVKVVGVVEESRIDEAFLKDWEKQVKAKTAEQHGTEDEGCESEKAAKQEKGNSTVERIADFRKRIAKRNKKEGKNYLSFYHVTALSYEILK